MLVIVSDLHLSDGTTGATLASGAFSLFVQRLRELALSASCRADGIFRPVQRIDLVLLGDTLDLLHSAHWREKPAIRPWGNTHSPEFIEQIARITSGIFAHNRQALALLRALGTQAVVTLPSAMPIAGGHAKPQDQPTPVRIHYMVGNHDWFYHLPGPDYDRLRQTLVEQMGLANRPDRPFPHDITESDELLQIMRRHKVTARHGDIHDPLSFEGDRDASSLGDAIVIELLTRFAGEVESALGDSLPVSALLGLRELDNIRPTLLVPAWMDGLLERTCPLPAQRKQVKTLWDRLADEFLSSSFVRQRQTWSAVNLIDGLAGALMFSKRRSNGWTAAVLNWMAMLRGVKSASYYPHALGEQDFRNRRAKHVVYGHTHVSEHVPLDASYAEGYVLDQMYFNACTWRRVHGQTQFAPGEHEFIASDAMTYLAFFQGDERGGRPYETWSGTLGYAPAEITANRIDVGRSAISAAQAIHAPHFAIFPNSATGMPSRRS